MVVRILMVCLLGLLTASWSLPAEAKSLPKNAVAVVNGKKISMKTFEKEVEELKKRFSSFGGELPESQLAKFKVRIIERLVEDELIAQEVARQRVRIKSADIDAEFEAYKSRTPGDFESFLKKTGKTVDQLKMDIKKRLEAKALVSKTMTLEPTSAEIKAYYDDNKARYKVKERVKAAHILIKLEADADKAQKLKARQKIDRLHKLAIKPNADFSELARQESEGPSAPRGGDLGFFSRGRMVVPFEKAAFSMKPGEVSKPVQTKFGWHILKVYEREEAGQKTFDQVKGEIRTRLEARKFRDGRTRLIQELSSKAQIEKLSVPQPAEGQ